MSSRQVVKRGGTNAATLGLPFGVRCPALGADVRVAPSRRGTRALRISAAGQALLSLRLIVEALARGL